MFENYSSIGIWGYGVVGQSVARFIHQNYPHIKITVFDNKQLQTPLAEQLASYGYTISPIEQFKNFLETNNAIFPSPGIDVRNYNQYQYKFINEVDLFFSLWKKPVIAITGTLGKTTITHIISELLTNSGHRVATGGNIGTALLDLLPSQETSDLAVIELSSFQLENSYACNPLIAVLTNLHPNHLDRHGTMLEYLKAKLHILEYQSPEQKALIPFALLNEIRKQLPNRSFVVHHDSPLSEIQRASLTENDQVYFVDGKAIKKYSHGHTETIIAEIPDYSYPINWAILCALYNLMDINTATISSFKTDLPEHRLAHIATIQGCPFFDDSKATIMQATFAAVQKLQQYDLLLLLGGTSKGVDRRELLKSLSGTIAELICFGAEAEQLHAAAAQYSIQSSHHATLEKACTFAYQQSTKYKKPAVLLSPGGASFDLFSDYKDRGKKFKEIVQNLAI